jgi:hypothetical protein
MPAPRLFRDGFKTRPEIPIRVVADLLVASTLAVKSKQVSDALWAKKKQLLPPEVPKPKRGRSRVDDRAALTGIVFVLKTGI